MQLRSLLKSSSVLVGVLSAVAVSGACSGSKAREAIAAPDDAGSGGFLSEGGTEGGPANIGGRDPVNCDEAAQFKTYVGCDYWPTVTANAVQEVFDYAVVVANVGGETANVTVTGPSGANEKATVAAGELAKIYLPWVRGLKGPEAKTPAVRDVISSSVIERGGAYHLVSDRPVVVYQFNPLQYKAGDGRPGKDWSDCVKFDPQSPDCNSYSNDASLLLPSTAMTGNYRLMGSQGPQGLPSFAAITATADGTTVEVKVGARGKVLAGNGVSAAQAGETVTLTLNAGDVAELVGEPSSTVDLTGSLVKASKPVQVITGVLCLFVPEGVSACDHVEETVFPAETLGKHYVVTRPTGPKANDVGHVVHFVGNFDATTLTYKPSKPENCPDFLNAGQVADCGEVTTDFEVTGDKEFGVAMFQLGGTKVDPQVGGGTGEGDPSQSFAVTVEQYRKSYVFLAPSDYKKSYVDVVAKGGTTLTLDGADVSSQLKELSGTEYLIARIALGAGKDGAHTLEGSAPIGIQVIGYGDYTSYQYPGGLNLSAISSVPVK